MISTVSSVVNHPQFQTIAMSLIRQLISKIGNSDKSKTQKDVEEIKVKLKEEFQKNEVCMSEVLQSKNLELESAREKNEKLSSDVYKLRVRLNEQKKAGTVSLQLLKEKEDLREKMEKMEKEKKRIQELKELKELEADEARKALESQKKQMDQMLDVVTQLILDDCNKDESNIKKKKEQLLEIFDTLEAAPQHNKQANKSKKKKNTQNVKQAQSKEHEQSNMAADFNNKPGPSNSANHQMAHQSIPGPSYMAYNMPQHMGNPHMPRDNNMSLNMGNYPQMPGPANMGNYPQMPGPANMGNFNNMPGYNHPPNHNQMNMSSPYPPQFNNNFVGPPLQMTVNPSHSFPSTGPAHLYHHRPNGPNQNQFNIVNKPNNLEQRQHTENKEQNIDNHKQPSKGSYVKLPSDKSNTKSGPGFDLWEELDKLKLEIKNKSQAKSDLMSKIPSIMAQVSGSTIPSKENYIKELSECMEELNNMSDSKTSNQIRNFPMRRGQGGRGGYNRNQIGYGNRGRKFSSHTTDRDNKDLNQNPDENNGSDDDVSSLCSEPPYQRGNDERCHGRRNFYHSNQQASKNWKKNSFDRNFRGKAFQGQKFSAQGRDTKEKELNQKAAEASDNDDSSSVTSETNHNQRNFRGRGRGNYRRGRFHHNNNGQRPYGSTTNIPSLLEQSVPTPSAPRRTAVDNVKKVERQLEPASYQDIIDKIIENDIPSLLDAISYKWDLTLKITNITMVAVVDGQVVNEKPKTLLDVIQFKDAHSDAVCVYSSS